MCAVALLDTAIPYRRPGTISPEQLDWLDTVAAETDRPLIVMGHHQQWIGEGAGSRVRATTTSGCVPKPATRSPTSSGGGRAIVAYTPATPTVTGCADDRPMMCRAIEIGCVKDFPGTWAEYRVYEGGVMQVVHRISAPEALEWSERCRHLYSDFGLDYADVRDGRSSSDRCFTIALR